MKMQVSTHLVWALGPGRASAISYRRSATFNRSAGQDRNYQAHQAGGADQSCLYRGGASGRGRLHISLHSPATHATGEAVSVG